MATRKSKNRKKRKCRNYVYLPQRKGGLMVLPSGASYEPHDAGWRKVN